MENENRIYLKRSEGAVTKIVEVAEFISVVDITDFEHHFTISKIFYTHNLDLQVGDLVDIDYSINNGINGTIDFNFAKKNLENKIRR